MAHITGVGQRTQGCKNAFTKHIARKVLGDTHGQYWRWTDTETAHQ